MDSQTKLIDYLFTGYRRDMPAVYIRDRYDNSSDSDVTVIKMKLLSGKILAIDEPQQTVNMIAEMTASWTDFRLTWNPAEHDGIESILVKQMMVWIPDLMIYDLVGSIVYTYADYQHVVLHYNGTAESMFASSFKILCDLKIDNFPFDKQNCAIRMQSANFLVDEFEFQGSYSDDLVMADMGSGEWIVDGYHITNEVFRNNIQNWDYPIIAFNIKIRRSPMYYVTLVIIPSFILTFLSVVGLFSSEINQESYMEKLGLGFSSILTLVLILQITTNNIPKTTQLPLLSLYNLLNLILVTVAVMFIMVTTKYLTCAYKCIENMDTMKKRCTPMLARVLRQLRSRIHQLYFGLFSIFTFVNIAILASKRGG